MTCEGVQAPASPVRPVGTMLRHVRAPVLNDDWEATFRTWLPYGSHCGDPVFPDFPG
jgi:hypothetical protein